MGSSKKHKEKDRDRESRHKRRRRSRSRSKERRERRRREKDEYREEPPRDYGQRSKDGRSREMDYAEELQNYAFVQIKEENDTPPSVTIPGLDIPPPDKDTSLSIEDTNRIRAKLGLKPLEVKPKKAESGDVDALKKEDVHAPPVNLANVQKTKKLKRKMEVMKEKRLISDKLSKIKTLGESDSDEDAKKWVKRSRQNEKERLVAEKRAKALEEMDAEFGIGSLVDEEFMPKKKTYRSRDLRGLKVEHAVDSFKEGKTVILTLQDKGILDDDGDILVNVNIADDESAVKNIEKKKKKPEYKPYDEPEYDEYGMIKENVILDKYDEEIDGIKKKTFEIGAGGKYNAEADNNMERIRAQLREQGQSLQLAAPSLATEYYTQEEAKTKFKKVRKKVRKIRKKEVVTADDLLGMPGQQTELVDFGSRARGGWNTESMTDATSDMHELPYVTDGIPIPVASNDWRMSWRTEETQIPGLSGGTDLYIPTQPSADVQEVQDEDLTGIVVEEDGAENELQNILKKTRKLKQKKQRGTVPDHIAIKVSQIPVPMSNGDDDSDDDAKGNIILNSTSEFCRSLGDIPTYGLAGNRDEERDELLDIELEIMERKKQQEEEDEQNPGWNIVDIDDKPANILEEEQAVLDDEPILSHGIGSALELAKKKGYLEAEKNKNLHISTQHAILNAQNYSIEDKRYDDLDEKFRKRERYGGGQGISSEFKEKEGYKPDVQLEYIDDSGRFLNAKEAFRQLSHRFHGKGSGKKKTEKRQKKVEEEMLMKQMSSTDTPLNTVALLKEKQKLEKTPYVILSGNKGLTSNSIAKVK